MSVAGAILRRTEATHQLPPLPQRGRGAGGEGCPQYPQRGREASARGETEGGDVENFWSGLADY
jgi:hypothetical protein